MSNESNAPSSTADRSLLVRLRRSGARWDPVRPRAVEAARAAIRWRSTDAELAELAVPPGGVETPIPVRSRAQPVLLSFEAPCLDVEVEVVPTFDGRRLIGQLAPARSGSVEVRHPGGSITVVADPVGRFAANGVKPGPVSLRCEPEDGSTGSIVETDWFLA